MCGVCVASPGLIGVMLATAGVVAVALPVAYVVLARAIGYVAIVPVWALVRAVLRSRRSRETGNALPAIEPAPARPALAPLEVIDLAAVLNVQHAVR
jgi:hypothetical protein